MLKNVRAFALPKKKKRKGGEVAGGRGGERKLTAPYDVERKETFKGIIQNHFVPMHLTHFRMSFIS